jgi:HEAT repeat protein
MNLKYITIGVLVLCLAPAIYYATRETPPAPEPSVLDAATGPALPEPQAAPAAEQGQERAALAPDEYEERRAAARIEAIDAMPDSNDEKTLTALGNALADPNAEVKEAALNALSERQGPRVTELLRRGLADPDPEFRLEVLEVLAERDDLDSLRRAKSDPAQDVRERAVELLESAGANR